jgi:hypothetical protein
MDGFSIATLMVGILSPLLVVGTVYWRNGKTMAKWTGTVETLIEGVSDNIEELKEDVHDIIVNGCPVSRNNITKIERLEKWQDKHID